jgi:sirohydrochlorin cobaltochelatase
MTQHHSPHIEKHGLLLVGHGTRDATGCEEFLATAQAVAARLPQIVLEPCFLELAEPTIEMAVERLVESQINHLSVMPLLLFAAGHAKDDIPQAVEAAIATQGLTPLLQASHDRGNQLPHLGCHAKLLELSAVRFAEAIEQRPEISDYDTTLVMVGRGSRDAQATAEMLRYAQLRHEQAPVARTEVCFVAMAQPSIEQCLNELSASAERLIAVQPQRVPVQPQRVPVQPQRIVVQPHLLFGGQLLARIEQLVTEMATRYPEKEWIVTRHLGPHPLLEDAIVDIVTSNLQVGSADVV